MVIICFAISTTRGMEECLVGWGHTHSQLLLTTVAAVTGEGPSSIACPITFSSASRVYFLPSRHSFT